MDENKNGRMIYVWGYPIFVVSNFDPNDGMAGYPSNSVCITMHYDGDMKNAGSLAKDGALYIDDETLPALIEALQSFLPKGGA